MTANLKLSGNRHLCRACQEYVSSDSVFDRHHHRIGGFGDPTNPRRCLTVTEMLDKGFAKSDRGFWVRRRREAGTIPR